MATVRDLPDMVVYSEHGKGHQQLRAELYEQTTTIHPWNISEMSFRKNCYSCTQQKNKYKIPCRSELKAFR
jgi:hypothetical protein